MSGHVALIVIDMQLGVFKSPVIPPVAGDKELLSQVTWLITKARDASVPIIFVQHNGGQGHPLERGTPGWDIHPDIAPSANDVVIDKDTPDSFYGTQLQNQLESQNIKTLVVCGIQTEFCVDTTCRRAFSLGYQVILAKNAHSTWDTDLLSASQIIAHHNSVLAEWFVKAKEVSEIDFDTISGNGGSKPFETDTRRRYG